MAFRFTLSDSTGRVVGSVWHGHLDRTYVLADGNKIPVHSETAWCRNCRNFVAAEHFPTDADLAGREQHVRQQYGWFEQYRREGVPMTQAHIEAQERSLREGLDEIAQAREWLLRRRAPPRCLDCGSTEIGVFCAGQRISHPQSGLTVTVTDVVHVSMAIRYFYTAEGERIE